MSKDQIRYPVISCPPGILLIEPVEPAKEVGGIYRPDSDKQKSQEGKVLAVGSSTKDREVFCKIDDIVIYRQWTGTEYKMNGKTYLFLQFEDVRGIKYG